MEHIFINCHVKFNFRLQKGIVNQIVNMHNLAHNVPVLNPPSSFVYNQFGSYGTTYNQVCQVGISIF